MQSTMERPVQAVRYDEIESLIFSTGFSALRPEPYLSVSEYADTHRHLQPGESKEPGPWRTDRVPYLKEIMDALSPHSPWEEVCFMKGSQIAATEGGNNWLLYIIDKAPAPVVFALPTLDLAKRTSITRLRKILDSTPTVKDKVAGVKSRDSSNSMLLKEFLGGFLLITGANSPAATRSTSYRYLFCDEVDAYPGDVGGEGDPIELFKRGTRTYVGKRKHYFVSTPTNEGKSRIEALFVDSMRMRFYVPCPRCGEYQVLKWNRVVWSEFGLPPEKAAYLCEHCGDKIYNYEKDFMLPRGEWRPDNPDYSGKRIGFHLSSLYSPVGLGYSWGEMAKLFVESSKNQELLKVFVNLYLGETFRDKTETPDWEKLYHRSRGGHARGIVPSRGLILVAGADVQKDRIEVEVVAYGRNLESFSVDYYVFPGETDNLEGEAWRQLDLLLSHSFQHEDGVTMQIATLAIDTGYATQTVYNWCRKYSINHVMPVKGKYSASTMLGHPRAVDVMDQATGKQKKRALKLWNIGVSIIKQELYGWLRLSPPDVGQLHSPGYCHFPEYEEEYFRQLTAETVKTVHSKGRILYEWENIRPSKRNEALDCRVYARAAAALLQLDRFNSNIWDQVEQTIFPEGRRKVKQVEPPATASTTENAPPQNQDSQQKALTSSPIASPVRRRSSRGIRL